MVFLLSVRWSVAASLLQISEKLVFFFGLHRVVRHNVTVKQPTSFDNRLFLGVPINQANQAVFELLVRDMAIFVLIKLLHDLDPEVIRHIQLVHQTVSVEVGESPLQLINAKIAVSILVKDVESDPDMLFVEHFSLVTCACQELLEADLSIIVLIHD